ncbi:murein biosynthesis integral membrane protein MurJ [Brackiella oedipodis]|uniref:murein biosynthesis integral membrane protein MurJ n=1 Tax=Brackiella oedipodis TaxID=124225 RepID=UPI000A057FCD|nr:lipid II flippase MurJ [Brackiella oedipodis]
MRVAFFLLIGKLAGALKEMAVANRYGVSDVVDAYQFTMTMSNWLPVTLVGVLSVVLVPTLVKLRYAEPQEQKQFLSQLQGGVLLVGAIIGILTWALWPWVIQYLATEFNEHAKQASQELILGFAPVAMMTVVIGVSMARLRARERHINTLLESMPAILILLCIFALPGNTSTLPLLLGTLIGTLLQAVILYYLSSRADQHYALPAFSLSSPYWSLLLKAAGIMLIGQIASSFVAPLDQMAAAKLGSNANATMGYATRLLSLIIGIGAASVGRAALPVLSDIEARGEVARARTIALKWSLLMVLAGVVVVALLWWLSPWMVHILFERGAFSSKNTTIVSEVLRYGLLQLPFYFGVLILVQLMASQNRYSLMAAIAVANFALKAVMNYYLAPTWGVQGIMLATALMYLLSFCCYFVAVSCLKPKKQTTPS